MTDLAALYSGLADRHAAWRAKFGRPLTLAEKILCSHLADQDGAVPERGVTYADLLPEPTSTPMEKTV